MICLTVSTEYRRVTEKRTDRQTDTQTNRQTSWDIIASLGNKTLLDDRDAELENLRIHNSLQWTVLLE